LQELRWGCSPVGHVRPDGSGGGGPPATAFKSPSTDGKRRSTRFKDEDEDAEVTLDVWGGGDGSPSAVSRASASPRGRKHWTEQHWRGRQEAERVPLIGDGGDIPSIEGMERDF
jgi:hypothetical protein